MPHTGAGSACHPYAQQRHWEITCRRISPTAGHVKMSRRSTSANTLNLQRGYSTTQRAKGIPVECVDTHSLPRGGGANELALVWVIRKRQSRKWDDGKGPHSKSTFWEELADYTDGRMSTAMKTKFNFMNISGNAFPDITETVPTMEYNTEFTAAGPA